MKNLLTCNYKRFLAVSSIPFIVNKINQAKYKDYIYTNNKYIHNIFYSSKLSCITENEFNTYIKENRFNINSSELEDIIDYQDVKSLEYAYENMSKTQEYAEYFKEKSLQKIPGYDYNPIEININLGSSTKIRNRSFNQYSTFDIYNKSNTPKDFSVSKYFNKILVYRIGSQFYSTSSICGYCYKDLGDGVFLGEKISCSYCNSEYSIKTGNCETGPNIKNLASFKVGLKDDNIIIRLPKKRLPLFKHHLETNSNKKMDPRHYVIIGETETTTGALHVLKQCFNGDITVIRNNKDNNYLNNNKLKSSLFPLANINDSYMFFDIYDYYNKNIKHKKDNVDKDVLYLQDNKIHNFYNRRNIQIINEDIHKIHTDYNYIALKSGIKVPYDILLIANGTKKVDFYKKFSNCFILNSVKNHSMIHNFLMNKNNKNIAIIGNSLESLNIACSARRLLDYNNRDSFKIAYIANSSIYNKSSNNIHNKICKNEDSDTNGATFFIESLSNKRASNMIINYLNRNNICTFNNCDVAIENQANNESFINNILLIFKDLNKLIRLPVNGAVIEESLINLDTNATINSIYERLRSIDPESASYKNGTLLIKDANNNFNLINSNILLEDYKRRITSKKNVVEQEISFNNKGQFMPRFKFTLKPINRFPNIFAAGNCSSLKLNKIPGYYSTDDSKINFDLGIYAAISSLHADDKDIDFYKFVPITSIHVLDKKLSIVGNPNTSYSKTLVYIDDKAERFVSYLILNNKIKGAVTYGYNKLDLYLKEALYYDLMPEPKFVFKNLDTAHGHIVDNVIKNSDVIDCNVNNQINKLITDQKIDLTVYDSIDQKFVTYISAKYDKKLDQLLIQKNKEINDIERAKGSNTRYSTSINLNQILNKTNKKESTILKGNDN